MLQFTSETAVVGVVLEGGFAAVAAVHEMVDGTGESDTQRTGHGVMASPPPPVVNG